MNIDEYYPRGFWPWNKIFGIGQLYGGMGSVCKYIYIYIYIYMYTHISVARMIRLPMFGHVCAAHFNDVQTLLLQNLS